MTAFFFNFLERISQMRNIITMTRMIAIIPAKTPITILVTGMSFGRFSTREKVEDN